MNERQMKYLWSVPPWRSRAYCLFARWIPFIVVCVVVVTIVAGISLLCAALIMSVVKNEWAGIALSAIISLALFITLVLFGKYNVFDAELKLWLSGRDPEQLPYW